MGYYGSQFSYAGKSSYEMGLMIYNLGNYNQGNGEFVSPDFIEDRPSNRYQSYLYGVNDNKSQPIHMVIGIDINTPNLEPLTRGDLREIGIWLTRQSSYQKLIIDQDDMVGIYFMCRFTKCEIIVLGGGSYGLDCSIESDSRYAYIHREYTYTTTTTSTQRLISEHDCIGEFYPTLTITLPSGVTSVSITNTSDSSRVFSLSGFVNSAGVIITADNKNQILSANTGENLYEHFNNYFFRLVRGENNLSISGNSTIVLTAEFPILIGG